MKTIFFTLFFFSASLVSLHAEVIDQVVAVVNNDVITLSEVNEAGKMLFQRVTAQAKPGELSAALTQVRNKVIEDMINKKIMEQHAEQRQIIVSEEELDAALAQVLSRSNATMAQFRQEINAMGMSETQYRDSLRIRILQSKLVNAEVRSRIVISEDQIIDYYDTHYTEQVQGGGYYILQIGFQADSKAENSADARARAERVLSLAKKGEDFKMLAKKYSDLPSAADGGDIGVFLRDDMAETMQAAILKLHPGEISDIVKLGNSFQIFKLLSSQEGEIVTKISYEDAKDEIQEILYEQEIKSKYDEWIQSMREQAYVKIL